MNKQKDELITSNDYHDYVIKDGAFIGKFEEMYENCENPWRQLDDERVNSMCKMNAIEIIKYLKIKSLVEFGCGLGAFTNKIYKETGLKITGVDCSKTAIEYAKTNFGIGNESINFAVDNINNIASYREYDCYLLADIMWYILDDLDGIITEMQKNLKGKYMINILSFYKGKQKYGVDKFTNPEQLIKYIPFENIVNTTIDLADNKDAYASVTAFKI